MNHFNNEQAFNYYVDVGRSSVVCVKSVLVREGRGDLRKRHCDVPWTSTDNFYG